ncbi:MAG: hypothetical protein ACJAYJ_002564, partial [Saprospiraceae bacterium]
SDTHINRPREKEEQKSQYSGKHKTHGIKNTFVNDEKAKILYLGPTTKGKYVTLFIGVKFESKIFSIVFF